tara:strand:+ start:571 stop:705 length:135 start_codon:yes stop_codon:yes gene_type:complete
MANKANRKQEKKKLAKLTPAEKRKLKRDKKRDKKQRRKKPFSYE